MNTEHDGLNKLRGIGRLAAMGCMLLAAGLAVGAEDLSAWQKRMPIAFSGYTPPGGGETLTNFPVLVILSNTTTGTGFAYNDFLSPPYGDLRFAAGDKTTQLDFEVESWDTNGLSHVWVQIPTLDGTNTQVWAFWGKSSVSAPVCTTNGAVWTNGFIGVWHMGATNGAAQVPDSVAVPHHGTNYGTTLTNGTIGSARALNGSSSIGVTGITKPAGSVTIEYWLQTIATGNAYLTDSESGRLVTAINQTTVGKVTYYDGSWRTAAGTGLTDGLWHHVVFSLKSANGTVYVDGNMSATGIPYSNKAIGGRVQIGAYHGGSGNNFNGLLDEVRISSVPRSSNWVWASYMNMAANAAFTTYGDPESQDLPSISPGGGATNVTPVSAWLNGTLSSTGTSDTAVIAYWGPTDGGTNASAWANTNTWAAPQTPGAFTIQATDLLIDSTYYYQFAASNATGWAWAAETSAFITGEVWIEKTADASEIGPTPGTFTVHRAATATNEAVTVTYTVGGTAIADIDYAPLSGTVMLAAGEDAAEVVVSPFFDNVPEGTETVTVVIASGPYVVGDASSAALTIADHGIVWRTWNGAGANALASNPANWLDGAAPTAGDAVLLDTTTNKNITWDLNLPLQSWSQVGYEGTVTIATVYGSTGFTNLVILGDCTISNGVWIHSGPQSSEINRIRATIGGNLIVGTNGAIDATGKGYSSARGPGGVNTGGGAAHGGLGQNALRGCYGSIATPISLGSGHRYNSGGGAICLTVKGTARVDGLISMDGTIANYSSYGAAGGSIWITAGALVGGGVIRANAGTPPGSMSSGGGRIALTVTNAGVDFSSFTGTIQTLGGSTVAGAGTIYLRTPEQGSDEGTMIVDSADSPSTQYAQIGPNVTDTIVGNVIIRNGGRLLVDADQTLTVSGVWSNGASFMGAPASSVIFAGGSGSTSTLYGATTFANLVCTNAGKTLVFPAGVTTAVSEVGGLILRGAADATNLFLRSSEPGEAWKLDVSLSASQSVWHVHVSDSDARLGSEVLAFLSHDGSGNENWIFSDALPGGTNVWTAAADEVWNNNANWSLERMPTAADSVRIPTGTPHDPVVMGQSFTKVSTLEIEAGASLSLNGYDFTVYGDAHVAGSLVCAGNETVTFQQGAIFNGAVTATGAETFVLKGNTDFSGCTFTPASATLLMAGNTVQTIDLANLIFYTVLIAPSAEIVFKSGFSAFECRCAPATGEEIHLTFEPGETMTVNRLMWLSEAGSTGIVLRSAQEGQTWALNVTNRSVARGVDVADCDASAGQTIYPSGSRDAGNNANWDFSGTWVEWTDQSGNGKFEDAANWRPAGIPGADSWVRIDSARPMTIASTVTLDRLLLGGSGNSASATINGHVTVKDTVTLFEGGTLNWNLPGVVSNDVRVMADGVLTHTANATTEANRLSLTVFGDVVVDEGGRIDVTGMGYNAKTGPTNPGGGSNGGSHGGRGGGGYACYGSITAPTNQGSGSTYNKGGGIIRLVVAGAIQNNGRMSADGSHTSYSNYGAAGGSIWVHSGTLVGSGIICANAGDATSAGVASGGGRIAVTVTNADADFSLFTGTVTARGGRAAAVDAPLAGAGTIYRQIGSDKPGRGTVEVENGALNGSSYTDVPPDMNALPDEVDRAAFHIANGARLRLTDHFTVGDIWFDTTNTVLDLGSHTLTVNTWKHDLGLGNVIDEGGKIVWAGEPPGMLIIVK